jgi:peptidyl-tRNA hydrolase, PTH1 family
LRVIVGLGNPGARYERTRHNIGFDVVDALAERHSIDLKEKRFKGILGKGRIGSEVVWLAKPQTFMNLSGDCIGPLAGFYKVTPEDVVVIHDELDLAFGAVKAKTGGGHGGHNGLRDLVKKLPSAEFSRVRVGVGRPIGPMDPAAWVLSRWTPDQSRTVPAVIARAADVVEGVVGQGIKEAMNRWNGEGPVQP